MGRVRAGVSGLSHMRALGQLPHVDLVAVADPPLQQAHAAAEHEGGTTCFADHNTMLRDAMPDAVRD